MTLKPHPSRLFWVPLLVATLYLGCQPDSQVAPAGGGPDGGEAGVSQSVLDKVVSLRQPVQQYGLSSTESTDITGELGTQIKIVPADLVTASGAELSGDLIVELTELPYAEDMVPWLVGSESGGQPQATGGAIHLQITQQGELVGLKPGKTLQVSFPCRVKGSMQLQYGAEDSLGRVTWMPAGVPLVTDAGKSVDHLATKADPASTQDALKMQLVRERDSLGIAGTPLDKFPLNTHDNMAMQAAARQIDVHTYHNCAPVGIRQMGWVGCGMAISGSAVPCTIGVEASAAMGDKVLVWAIAPDAKHLSTPLILADTKAPATFKLPAGQWVRLFALSMDTKGGYQMAVQDLEVTDGPANALLKLAPATPAQVRHYVARPLSL